MAVNPQTPPPTTPQTSSANQPTNTADTVVRPLGQSTSTPSVKNSSKKILVILVIIFAGIGSGYSLTTMQSGGPVSMIGSALKSTGGGASKIMEAKEAGVKDDDQFPDSAEGLLEVNDGSVTMEGTHQLIREGGPDKTAYLTSSVVDLSKFEGRKVMVMGQTFSAQTAAWLMDVGYIKVLE